MQNQPITISVGCQGSYRQQRKTSLGPLKRKKKITQIQVIVFLYHLQTLP